jgi:signal transduction histidine kinase
VAKHSGAKEAKVNLIYILEQVVLRISDDGQGFNIGENTNKSLGLGIIHERAREIGASLSIQSVEGHGTEITVTWKHVTPGGHQAGPESSAII